MKEMNMGQMKMFFEACKSNSKEDIEDLRIEFDITDDDIDIIFQKVADDIKSSIYNEETTKDKKEDLKDENIITINGVTLNANDIADARILANIHAINIIDVGFSINDYLDCTNKMNVLTVIKEIKALFGITDGALIGLERVIRSDKFGYKYLTEASPLEKMTDPLGLILLCISNIKNYLTMVYSEDMVNYEITEKEGYNLFNITMGKVREMRKEACDFFEEEIKQKDMSELSKPTSEENFNNAIDKVVNELITSLFRE